MMTFQDVIVNLLPPILIMISGYSLRVMVRGKAEGIIETWIVSAVLGSALLVVPSAVIGSVWDGSLRIIFWAYVVVTVVLASLALRLKRTTFLFSFKRLYWLVRDAPKSSGLEVVAFAGIASLFGKAIVVLSIGQLGVDAMASVLPNALYFKDFNGFGSFADPPAVSLLFSWALSTVGLVSTDAFRLIPLVDVIGIPGLIFLVARKYLGRTPALAALALSSFAPLIDQSLLVWAHYADLPGLFFAFAGIWFLLRERSELLSGLSLALALLSKSLYGLAGALLCVFIILGASPNRRVSRGLFVVLISVILAYGWVSNGSKISEISPGIVSLVAALLMITFAAVSFARAQPTLKVMPKIPLLLFGVSPAILWVLRQVLMGGSPLALPLIGTSNVDASWWLRFQSEIIGPVQLDWTVLLSVFCYPSFDLYLTPFVVTGILLAFRRSEKLLFLFAASYALYFGSMGAFFLARHLAIFMFSLYPLAAVGLVSLASNLKEHRGRVLGMGIVTYVYALTSMIQQPRGYLSLQWLSSFGPSPLAQIAGLVRPLGVSMTPWLDYPDGVNLDMFRVIVQGLVLASIVVVLVRSLGGRFRLAVPAGSLQVKPRMEFRKLAGVLLILLTFSAMAVEGYYSAGGKAVLVAGANPLSFPVAGSWYRERIETAMEVAGMVPRGETVLTFSFGAYYYLATAGIYYVDLIDGTLSSYPLRGLSFTTTLRQLLQSENLADIKSAFTSIDVAFMLIPRVYNSTVPFEYSTFEKFNQNSDLLRILREADGLNLVWERGHYQLYALRIDMLSQQNNAPQAVDCSLWLCVCTWVEPPNMPLHLFSRRMMSHE